MFTSRSFNEKSHEKHTRKIKFIVSFSLFFFLLNFKIKIFVYINTNKVINVMDNVPLK
jgi:hypothetical protein